VFDETDILLYVDIHTVMNKFKKYVVVVVVVVVVLR
jgi:hypothetical protein